MGDTKPLAELVDNEPNRKVPGAPGAVVVAEDPAAPSPEVSSKKQRLSDLFTIVCGRISLTTMALGKAKYIKNLTDKYSSSAPVLP